MHKMIATPKNYHDVLLIENRETLRTQLALF